jgi:hypothetical protein
MIALPVIDLSLSTFELGLIYFTVAEILQSLLLLFYSNEVSLSNTKTLAMGQLQLL